MRTSCLTIAGAGLLSVCVVNLHAGAALVEVTRVAHQNQVVVYNAVPVTLTSINSPYTNSLGKVGFTGNGSVGGNFVWYDTGITWQNSDDTSATVTGAETTMGVSDTGGFIYSPSYNGFDAVYTHDGKLLADGDPHPAVPGQFSSFNSRPIMTPNGTAYWIGGYSATAGGATAGRIFQKCTDTTNPATIVKILQSGDIVDGLPVTAGVVGFAYDASDNNLHYCIYLTVGAVAASDGRVIVDGVAVAREGGPTGAGDIWSTTAMANCSVNNAGSYIFTGDTNAASNDQVMVYNGSVVLREGTVVDGWTLGGATNAASINNIGKVAFIWSTTTPTNEVLFHGDAATPNTATALLAVGDTVDYTGDGIADATVNDFEASVAIAPGLSLSDQNFVFVEVTLTDLAGGAAYEAILKVPTSVCLADTDNNGAVDVLDLLAVINAWGACPAPCPPSCPADIDSANCQVDVLDLLMVINTWGPCP